MGIAKERGLVGSDCLDQCFPQYGVCLGIEPVAKLIQAGAAGMVGERDYPVDQQVVLVGPQNDPTETLDQTGDSLSGLGADSCRMGKTSIRSV